MQTYTVGAKIMDIKGNIPFVVASIFTQKLLNKFTVVNMLLISHTNMNKTSARKF